MSVQQPTPFGDGIDETGTIGTEVRWTGRTEVLALTGGRSRDRWRPAGWSDGATGRGGAEATGDFSSGAEARSGSGPLLGYRVGWACPPGPCPARGQLTRPSVAGVLWGQSVRPASSTSGSARWAGSTRRRAPTRSAMGSATSQTLMFIPATGTPASSQKTMTSRLAGSPR